MVAGEEHSVEFEGRRQVKWSPHVRERLGDRRHRHELPPCRRRANQSCGPAPDLDLRLVIGMEAKS